MHRSTLITLENVVEQRLVFNIPIYQRIYVWGADQIKLLLDDIVAAYANQGVFYLGGTLVIEQGSSRFGRPLLDLIDGQQRFTTMWLLSIALQRMTAQRNKQEINHLAGYRFVLSEDIREPRIRFAIRPEVTRFFEALLHERDVPEIAEANALSHAIQEMESYFNEHPDLCMTGFSHFIHQKVKLVLTRVPAKTDLNKLFEVVNNRGVQLQHHEILKARLLGNLSNSRQREIYGQLWDACSYMNDYVEKNLRTVTGMKLVPLFGADEASRDEEALGQPDRVVKELEQLYETASEQTFSLEKILESDDSWLDGNRQVNNPDEAYESDAVRSIITFPMLLQHVLRIFLMKRDEDIDKILDKELLRIFDDHWLNAMPSSSDEGAGQVMAFIKLLWRCRYLFDKHLIKWVEGEDGEVHAIRRLRITTSRKSQSLTRDSNDAASGFAMLQSMLYHSQQLTTHYWLTPLLNYLLRYGGARAHLYLKYLDNHLLCSDDRAPLIERTRLFLQQPWCRGLPVRELGAVLSTSEGTGFSHYWFYKLEYILWDTYAQQKGAAWQNFRMTAKNSVEHVSPQNPESFDSNKVSEAVRDTFGNLALVSRSINSEYSNKPYVEKRARFRERNAARADSLKLSLIFDNPHWSDELAIRHCNAMIAEYQAYVQNVDAEAAARELLN